MINKITIHKGIHIRCYTINEIGWTARPHDTNLNEQTMPNSAWIFLILFDITSVVYLSETEMLIRFKTRFCLVFKMVSSGLKENVVPNKIVARNVVLYDSFLMMLRVVMLWVLRCFRTLQDVGRCCCQCWFVVWVDYSADVRDYHRDC